MSLNYGEFAPRSGCPLCSVVATPFNNNHHTANEPWRRNSSDTSVDGGKDDVEIIYKDSNVTAYLERRYPVSSKGHIIIVLNLHVPSIYTLSSTDLPLLNHIQALATRLLYTLSPPAHPASPSPLSPSSNLPLNASNPAFSIGFITPPFRDSKIPITDHLHAHAYVGTADLAGWWRGVAYGPLGWYAIEDLIAEIRESTSNNRIKTGYANPNRPIDRVPGAGARAGNPDGSEAQFLPLPLQVNKAHLSPAPTPLPGLRVTNFEHVVSGSVDLGTGFGASGSEGSMRLRGGEVRVPSKLSEGVEMGMEEAAWDDGVGSGAFVSEPGVGEAGPGPSSSRSLSVNIS